MAGTVAGDCSELEVASFQGRNALADIVIADRLADVKLVYLYAVQLVSLHRQDPKPRHSGTIRDPTRKDWFIVLLQP
jgi:hypothetical protein